MRTPYIINFCGLDSIVVSALDGFEEGTKDGVDDCGILGLELGAFEGAEPTSRSYTITAPA